MDEWIWHVCVCVFVSVCFAGIRSVSFYEHIVTVGTGQGSLLFYDIRAHRFLEDPSYPVGCQGSYRNRPTESILKLTTGKGWLVCPLNKQILLIWIGVNSHTPTWPLKFSSFDQCVRSIQYAWKQCTQQRYTCSVIANCTPAWISTIMTITRF